ncbi:MAG: LLM class flavin-dependent oxidoreductase, partial [bacterium]|nr:LLM class flavin-dependent oxidoreductase [bacterium]
ATANTFREPTLLAKMITTLDHISGGRAFLGIGAGWFEEEHTGYGFAFGAGPGERLGWLGEALPLLRSMLAGEPAGAAGGRYRATAAYNDPRPVQERIPIIVAGDGERVTLKLVARYGDACNFGFHHGADALARKDRILRAHCADVGRDESEIARTAEIRVVIIRDTRREADRVYAELRRLNGDAPIWPEQPVGTPDDVFEKLAPVVALGFRHIICGFPYPHDAESMVRLRSEVLPRLQAVAGGG